MKKIDMYREVPEQFHNKLCDTLEQLEEKKIVKFSVKKYVAACAVALLATSTITVGAMELFEWYQAASERFETSRELENKLTSQGVAIPVEDSDEQLDMKMSALQAVKTDENFYLLAALEWPEELEWNEDILFEESKIIPAQEFGGCTVNFAGEPDENGIIYVEIDVLGKSNAEYVEDVTVVLKNLIQTEKTETTDILVEAEWELTFSLPTNEDTRSFLTAELLPVNGHNLSLERLEINAFAAKLYTEEEQGRHASYYSDMELAAVQYEDGSRIEQYGDFLRNCTAKDEEGKFYFNLSLNNAVDVDKINGLVFEEKGREFVLALGEKVNNQMAENENLTQADKATLVDLLQQESEMTVEDFRILYVRHDNVILSDSKKIYLWDAQCDNAKMIMNLTDYDYNEEKGGEIAMMPGGVVVAVHPMADSNIVYMLDMDNYDVQEVGAEGIWPVPGYEDYKNSFFKVSDKNDLPEGVYATEGYEAQGRAFVLYSADGSVENMELLDINKD